MAHTLVGCTTHTPLIKQVPELPAAAGPPIKTRRHRLCLPCSYRLTVSSCFCATYLTSSFREETEWSKKKQENLGHFQCCQARQARSPSLCSQLCILSINWTLSTKFTQWFDDFVVQKFKFYYEFVGAAQLPWFIPKAMPELRLQAARMLCMFGNQYQCEQLFSLMKMNKTWHRSRHSLELSTKH